MSDVPDEIIDRRADRRSTAKLDIVVITVIGIAAYFAAFVFGLGDHMQAFIADHRRWQLDEIPVAMILMAVGVAWFAMRRWKEYYREAQERRAVQAELLRAHAAVNHLNETLERRIEERTAELRAAQDELVRKERLATLGQLTATVSHELRNPLGVLRNTMFTVADAVRENKLDLERPLARIDRSISRCNNIITELLDYTRISHLKLQAERIDTWLNELLAEYHAPEGITLIRDFGAADTPVSIDADRLRRAVINLLDNAAQAMTGSKFPNGQNAGTITLRLRQAADRVELTIADTGPGIPAEVLPRIFEPLFSTKGFGVGLGLPTVRQIIEQHGGTIEITSEPGQGAVARLSLPVARDDRIAA